MQRFIGLIVGVIFLGVSAFMYFKNDSLVKNCTAEAEATVVDMEQNFSSDSDGTSYLYYPIIEYIAEEKTVRVTMDNGSSTPAYNIGEKIAVMYNPNKPKEFYVKGNTTSNIFTIVFAVLGTLITGYGVYMAVKKN